jgi:5-bromo-4-chloroindolyl phosphate hydrolysis protein
LEFYFWINNRNIIKKHKGTTQADMKYTRDDLSRKRKKIMKIRQIKIVKSSFPVEKNVEEERI